MQNGMQLTQECKMELVEHKMHAIMHRLCGLHVPL